MMSILKILLKHIWYFFIKITYYRSGGEDWESKRRQYYEPLISISSKLRLIKMYPSLIFQEFQREVKIVPRISYFLTSRCSLKCEACSALSPYFEEKNDIEYAEVISDIKQFEKHVKSIECFGFFGGEPFLYKDIDKVIEYVGKSRKIHRVEITTNSICSIKGSTVELLKKYDIHVKMSYYGGLNRKQIAEKKELFSENNISNSVITDNVWWDFGLPKEHHRSRKENESVYESCFVPNMCRTLCKGYYMVCSRGPFLLLSQGKIFDDGFYNLYDSSYDWLYQSYQNENASICDWCSYNQKQVKIAKQYEGED